MLYVCPNARNTARSPTQEEAKCDSVAPRVLRENGEAPLQAALHARRQQAIAAGGIAAAEAIRNRAVKQRDESNARTANANMACKIALGKLDLSELRRES